MTLTRMARLSVTTETAVVLADGLNPGVYVREKGRFHVGEPVTSSTSPPRSGEWKVESGELRVKSGELIAVTW